MRRRALLAAVLVFAAGLAYGQETFDDLVREGRLALDTARLDLASSLFEKAAAVDPERIGEISKDRSWTYVRMGMDALGAGGPARADQCFTLAAAIYPPFKEVFLKAWAHSRMSEAHDAVALAIKNPRAADWSRIEDDLKWVTEAMPGDARAHYLLGLTYQAQRRNDDARREYAAAMGGAVDKKRPLSAIQADLGKSLTGRKVEINLRPVYPPRLAADPGPWQIHKDLPFIIYHHNRELAQRVGEVLKYELTLPVLDGVLTPQDAFPQECKVYIFADAEQFQSSGGKETWAAAQSKFTTMNGRMTSAAIQLFQTVPELTESAVPHELTHVRLVASRFFFDGIPLWLQEGVASSTESQNKHRIMARQINDAAQQNALIPLDVLMGLSTYPSEQSNETFYAECCATVESLVERSGKEQFWRFMEALKTMPARQAVSTIYGLSTRQLEDMVKAWTEARTDVPE